jgi:hypothetical protein
LHTQHPALLEKVEKQVATMEEIIKKFPLNDPKVGQPRCPHLKSPRACVHKKRDTLLVFPFDRSFLH